MLTVYTAQYRYDGHYRTDLTVKGADPPWNVFAPTWDMVNAYLKGPRDKVSEQKYIVEYDKIVLKAFMYKHNALSTLLNSNDTRVLVCFCQAGSFCHRVLLAMHLSSLGANYLGELYKGGELWTTDKMGLLT